MSFQRINNLTGWGVFFIAFIVYYLTVEETASYWDCGEFIAVAYKLEVPHPPGAPLFLLLGRLFSFFSFGDTSQVALAINMMSVLASALTILFLFWSIVLLGRKMITNFQEDIAPNADTLTLMGMGMIGSLVYTFSDSFWFSAAEAEVYAFSSFFTAFIVWGMLKWEKISDANKSNRWLLLIGYMVGLSIGIHLLNLVTLPALALIYYFKKYKPSAWGVIATLIIGLAMIFLINNLIITGLPSVAGNFEIFFVNTLSMPFGSGIIVFCVLVISILVTCIVYTHHKEMVALNTFALAITFVLIGYCSYATIIIRSNANTPINENAPNDIISIVSYLKREQYGSRPLFYGPYFTSQPIDFKEDGITYKKGKDRYEVANKKMSYVYDKNTFLPRAWDANHAQAYRSIMGIEEGRPPTFLENIRYMLGHQMGTMFMRYFMWNFAGRANDLDRADWLSPMDWFETLPEELQENKARNNFFMIPLLLGLLGASYQFRKNKKGFAIVGMLFIMLGVAIVFYLNAPPVEPRERDYIYTGAAYAFAFWVGFAVLAIAKVITAIIGKRRPVATVISAMLIALPAPALMATEGWDDHNRSNRFFSLDSGKNYLVSCAQDAVLFTGGDNDTFMLWYAQEVEGVRTDMRVVVLSYYNTDWYIQQSTQNMNQSKPLQYTISLENYRQGGPNDYLPYVKTGIETIDIKEYLRLLESNNPLLRDTQRDVNIVPSKILTIDIDKEVVLSKNIIPKGMDSLVVDQMSFRLKGNSLEKKDLAFLDILATNNWDRPLYVNNTSLSQFNIDLRPYIVHEGLVSRILPIKNPNIEKDLVNIDRCYENVIHQYGYSGLDNEKIYYTEDYKNFVANHRSTLNMLAESLIDEGDTIRAKKVVQFSLKKITDKAVMYDHTSVETVNLLYRLGEREQAKAIASLIGKRAKEGVLYYKNKKYGNNSPILRKYLYMLVNLDLICRENDDKELAEQFKNGYTEFITRP